MPHVVLTDAQLRELFPQAAQVPEWEKWRNQYRALLQRISGLEAAELAAPSRQEELWRARDITPVGPGESVNVEGAYSDPEITSALLALKTRTWSPDPM